MADTKHNYRIRLAAENGKQVVTELNSIGASGEKNFQRVETAATRADTRMNIMARSILTRVVPALSAGAFLSAVRNGVKELGDLNDQAERLGVTAETLQLSKLLGEEVNVDGAQALEYFVQQIGQAQQGLGKLLPVLEHYNIAVRDSSGNNRTSGAILRDLADVLNRTSEAQERLFIGRRAFGSENAGFVDALKRGSDGLEAFRQKAIEAGLVVREDLVKAADEFDTAWNRALLRSQVYFKSWTIYALQSMQTVADSLTNISLRLGAQMMGGPMGKVLEDAARGPQASLPSDRYSTIAELSMPTSTIPPASGTLADDDKAEKAAEQHAKRVQEVIKDLQQRNAQLQRGADLQSIYNDALGITNKEQELWNQLNKAGVDLGSQQGQAIEGLVNQWYEVTEAQRQSRKEVERFIGTFEDLGDAAGTALEDIVVDGKDAGDALNNLAKEVERIFFRAFVTKPLTDFFTNISGDIFKSFGGFRAEGGPVSAGRSYIVGERGPELFSPSRGGTIIPNGMGGGTQVAVQVVNNLGVQAQTTTRRKRTGSREDITVTLDALVAQKVADPDSRTYGALRGGGPGMVRRG